MVLIFSQQARLYLYWFSKYWNTFFLLVNSYCLHFPNHTSHLCHHCTKSLGSSLVSIVPPHSTAAKYNSGCREVLWTLHYSSIINICTHDDGWFEFQLFFLSFLMTLYISQSYLLPEVFPFDPFSSVRCPYVVSPKITTDPFNYLWWTSSNL